MAEISKQGLSVINGINFPDNTTGYITPEKLRTFNQDMIDSTVNQIVYDNTQTNLNQFTASITASVQELLNLSSSLSGGYVTQGELADATGSLITSINTKLNTSSFNSYTASIDSKFNTLQSTTASLLVETQNLESFTASANIRLNNLETTSASVNISVANLNSFTSSVSPISTGSLLITSSYSGTTLTFTKGNGTTYSHLGLQNTASFNSYTQSINSFTSSISTSVGNLQVETNNLELTTASLNISVANLNAFSASENTKAATLQTYTASVNVSLTNINAFTSSQLTQNSTLATYTGSVESRFSTLATYTGSVNTSLTNINSTTASLLVETANLESFSSSTLTRLTNIEAATSSYAKLNTNNVYSGSQTITGSVYGNIIALSIVSNTASMDCSLGNYFTLTLANSVDTHLAAANIKPGQTINLLVTQGSPIGTISYNSTFDFPFNNAYSASAITSSKDIVSFISFDSTTLYGAAVKNLV